MASREADAARRRQSRAADATAALRCVWSGLCAARCVMCVGQVAAYVLCLVAPEMSGGPSLRCQYGIYDIYTHIYTHTHTHTHTYIYIIVRSPMAMSFAALTRSVGRHPS